MAYAGIENSDFCGNVDCIFAGCWICSICDVNSDDYAYLYPYEKPVTLIETKEEHEQRLSELPF